MAERPELLKEDIDKRIDNLFNGHIKVQEAQKIYWKGIFDKAINQNVGLRALLKSSGLYDKFQEYIPRVFMVLNSTEEGKQILIELGVFEFLNKIK